MKTRIFTLIVVMAVMAINSLNAQGFDWAQGTGSSGDDVVMAQKTDNSGNHYLCGYFSGPVIQFGNETLTNANGTDFLPDLYLVKYDADWNVLWAFTPDDDADAYGDIYVAMDIDVDQSGNCYLTGSFLSQNISFGSVTLNNTHAGQYDPFVVKFNGNGSVQWAQNFGGNRHDKGRCVSVSPSGNSVYVAGWFYSDTLNIGGISYLNSDASTNTSDIYLVKFDANGNVIYGVVNGSDNIDRYRDIAVNANGDVVTVGTFKGTGIAFGNDYLVNANNYFDDGFVAVYNPDGTVKWSQHLSGGLNDDPVTIALNNDIGRIYITGSFNSSNLLTAGHTIVNYNPGSGTYDGFVLTFSNNGNYFGLIKVGGLADDAVAGLVSDSNNDFYITGSFKSETLYVSDFAAEENSGIEGTSDMFVVKFNQYQMMQWVKTATGDADDAGTAVCLDGDDVYVFGQSDADVSFNNIALTNQGGYDIFMARISQEMNVFSGRVYYDQNNNGHMDDDDIGVSDVVLQVGDDYYLSGEDGNFEILLPTGNFTVVPQPSDFFTANPESINVNFAGTGEVSSGNNIALLSAVDTAHLEVSVLSVPSARKGQEFISYLSFRNTGTVPLDTTSVSYPLQDDLIYLYSNPPEDEMTEDSVFWNVYDLQPFEERVIEIHQQVDTVLSGDSSNLKNTDAWIAVCFGWWVCRPVLWYIDCYYVDDCYEVTDPNTGQTTTQCDTVPVTDPETGDTTGYTVDSVLHCDYYYWPVCWWNWWCIIINFPHDPNEIYVTPNDSIPYTPQMVADRQPLDYTIRFQNTGNDTCFNAVVIDTLDENLDVSTFEMIGASHKYKASIDGRVLKFTFNNILLPDSTTNEPASHGYVKYRIKPVGDLQIGDSICNRADIYFDYEPAVLTNTVVTRVAEPDGIEENEDKGSWNPSKVRIAPNPFSQNATVYLPDYGDGNSIFEVYDMTGRLVKEMKVNGQHIVTLNRGNLTNGMYVYVLKAENNTLIDRGKFILR